MELGDLLTELRENILHDRSDQVAGQSDQLWSDKTLVRYINEAQRRFARRAYVIRDGTSDATRVTLVAGQTHYPLHEAVLAVISARMEGDQRDLVRAGHAALDSLSAPTTEFWDPAQAGQLPPGRPLAFTTDDFVSDDPAGAAMLRIYPEPDAAVEGDVLHLRLVRMPLEALTEDDLEAIPEIPADHHIEMLDWAAYLALRIVDHDAENAERASAFRASFEEHVVEARKAALRKLFAPMPWGFGRGGFAWEK